MRAHIASQAAYQLAVVFALLASGSTTARVQRVRVDATRQPDKLSESERAFQRVGWRTSTFLGIFASEVGLQVLIVQRGGVVFDTEPLDANQWAACVALGLVALPLRAVVNAWLNASERGDDAQTPPRRRRGERT